LFTPAEREYAQVGDDSALHIIVLDEMDAIAKKRGTVSSDTTGVRDSVVNQLLSCMDVRQSDRATLFQTASAVSHSGFLLLL
jgi:SpoVK/Ycf46/Vps4 family AAA+-type ATPase